MRLQRLDLIRYGKFTDKTLDFGPRLPGQPDLHIVYGPNEAGKSTAMSAWLDLLYGIPGQSGFGFLHPYATMRIGAALDLDGQTTELARIKAQKSSLQDPRNAPLPEALLQSVLGGLDRAGYQAMFSLDDDTLERGGESILASQGDLGQLLFAASAGLSGLSAQLDALRRLADQFHRPGARTKTTLAELKATLEALEAERKLLDTQASEYARLTAAEADHAAQWRALQQEQSLAAANTAAIQRRLAALIPFARLQPLLIEIQSLADLPDTPVHWRDRQTGLENEIAGLSARIEETAAAVTSLTAQLTSLHPDPAVLDLAPSIAEAAQLRSAFDEAQKDLGARRTEVRDLDLATAAQLQQLGRAGTDARTLLLPATKLAALRDLVEGWSGVKVQLSSATAEAAAAARDAEAAEHALGQAKVVAADTDALAELLSRLRQQDPGQAERLARREVAETEASLSQRLAELHPWAGDPLALAAMAPPAQGQIDRWIVALDQNRQAYEAARLRLERAQAEVTRLADVPAASSAGHVTLAAITVARARRETKWAAHLRDLVPESASVFEAAMRDDDQISAQYAQAQADAAAIARYAQLVAAAAREAELATDTLNATKSALSTTQAEVAHAISAMSPYLSDISDPAALRDWLARRVRALEVAAHAARARAALESAIEALSSSRAVLRDELSALGENPGTDTAFDRLIAKAEVLCERAKEGRALCNAAATAKAMSARRAAELVAAQTDLANWETRRAKLLQNTWLDGPTLPDVSALRETLAILDMLDRNTAEQDRLHDRIAKMETNVAGFADAVRHLAIKLDFAPAGTSQTWAEITARLTAAQQEAQSRLRLTTELEGAQSRLLQQEGQLATLENEVAAKAAIFGAKGLEALRAGLARAARKAAIQSECAALQQDILSVTGTSSLADALVELDGADRAQLTEELSRLQALSDQLGHSVQHAYAALAEARRQLAAVGGDDAVARLDTARQTVLMQIAEGAEAHLRRRLGILAVDQALRAYRDTHRSAMLERATVAFATISRGAYTGLAAQPEKDGEVLVALSRDGGAKLARDLSKGTRFQLYLALRVAGYHELARTRPPVPFIADDIMETFDDDRSAEAFALLADMAEVGQVIYLTHHKHLCVIAQQVCPAARFHDLS